MQRDSISFFLLHEQVGKLRNAPLGLFQIENRDSATPERKLVRVVVEYEVHQL